MRRDQILFLLFAAVWPTATAPAQQEFKLSAGYDAIDAPSTYPFPGFSGSFRQQVLISASRLQGLVGRGLKGIRVRRDLHDTGALTGGAVDLEVRLSSALVAPERGREVFDQNVPPSQVTVFRGRVIVPGSPPLNASSDPWSTDNSVRVDFTTSYPYRGGDLCLDLRARAVPAAEPQSWFVDYERGRYDGGAAPLGRSCSPFADLTGQTLYTNHLWLQIGSTMRLIALGRPGATPLLMIGAGAIQGGVDLSATGAVGCRQYVNPLFLTPLAYAPPAFPTAPASLHFEVQIPADGSLLGRSVFAQTADDERALPASQRSNVAGLTTSNGLELRVSSVPSGLGMSIVTSRAVDAATPFPTRGRVDVTMGPVLRVVH